MYIPSKNFLQGIGDCDCVAMKREEGWNRSGMWICR